MNLGFVPTYEVERAVSDEKTRRRKLRLLQVRTQTRQFANKVRNIVSKKKDSQIRDLEKKVEKHWKSSREVILEDLEVKYSDCFSRIEGKHDYMQDVVRVQQRKVEALEVASRTSIVRGETALSKVRGNKEVADRKAVEPIVRRRIVRAQENKRASAVSSLPPPTTDKAMDYGILRPKNRQIPSTQCNNGTPTKTYIVSDSSTPRKTKNLAENRNFQNAINIRNSPVSTSAAESSVKLTNTPTNSLTDKRRRNKENVAAVAAAPLSSSCNLQRRPGERDRLQQKGYPSSKINGGGKRSGNSSSNSSKRRIRKQRSQRKLEEAFSEFGSLSLSRNISETVQMFRESESGVMSADKSPSSCEINKTLLKQLQRLEKEDRRRKKRRNKHSKRSSSPQESNNVAVTSRDVNVDQLQSMKTLTTGSPNLDSVIEPSLLNMAHIEEDLCCEFSSRNLHVSGSSSSLSSTAPTSSSDEGNSKKGSEEKLLAKLLSHRNCDNPRLSVNNIADDNFNVAKKLLSSPDLNPGYMTRSPDLHVKPVVRHYVECVSAQCENLPENLKTVPPPEKTTTISKKDGEQQLKPVVCAEGIDGSVKDVASEGVKVVSLTGDGNLEGQNTPDFITAAAAGSASHSHPPLIPESPEYTPDTPSYSRQVLAKFLYSRKSPAPSAAAPEMYSTTTPKRGNVAAFRKSASLFAHPSTSGSGDCVDRFGSPVNVRGNLGSAKTRWVDSTHFESGSLPIEKGNYPVESGNLHTESEYLPSKMIHKELEDAEKLIKDREQAVVMSDRKVEDSLKELKMLEDEKARLERQLLLIRSSVVNVAVDVGEEWDVNPCTISEENRNHTVTDRQADHHSVMEDRSVGDCQVVDDCETYFDSNGYQYGERRRPPPTVLRGMDRTPHELSTIWELDSTHRSFERSNLSPSSSGNSRLLATPTSCSLPLKNEKSHKDTEDSKENSQNRNLPFYKIRLSDSGVELSNVLNVYKDLRQQRTCLSSHVFCGASLMKGPGIMEESQITLVESEFTSPTNSSSSSPKKFSVDIISPTTPLKTSSPFHRFAALKPKRAAAGGVEEKSPSITSTPTSAKDDSASDSLLSFEQHEAFLDFSG